MRAIARINWIVIGIVVSLALPTVGSVLSAEYFPDSQFANLPIHSLIEAAGGLMAIAIAGILVVERPRKENADHYPWMAGALIGMGVLDLFHAGVMPGANFVWLHSTATFVGGALFACVWWGSRGLPKDWADKLPWVALVTTIVFGFLSCVYSSMIPTMAVEGNFTFLARALNIGGGIGFLIAGVFFVGRFFQRSDQENWLFAVHTILFGAAGILFELSALWDAAWWWWHILRMGAYLAALTFAIRAYLDAEHEVIRMNRKLNELNRNLDKSVEERTSELSHERFLLQTLLDHLPDAIYFKDRSGKYTRVSNAFGRRVGLDPHELIGKSVEDVYPSELAAEFRADEIAVMESREPLIGKEEKIPVANKNETWYSTTKLPLPDPDGRIIGTFGLSHDVTIQKMAEANFRRVIDAAPNPLVVVGSDGRIELTNAATEDVFGYSMDELIGQPIEILVPEKTRSKHKGLVLEFLEHPQTRAMGADQELTGRHKDGSLIPVEIALNPVQLNEESAVLASVIDITARKQVQDALVSAKQAAEKANQAKSDFLANMSHEIRTPMNAIIGMTELLLNSELNATQQDYLTTVLESAEALLKIINEILDFSKIEAGQLELEQLEFDIRAEFADMLRTIGNRAFQKGLELNLQVDSQVPTRIIGDPIRIRQILLNLVGNAIKFTEQGEVDVAVSVLDSDSQSNLSEKEFICQVEVRDTGLGIAKDKLDSIFAAFAQADTSTTRQFGGTGLGLTICSRLAEAMGGTIGVESKVNEGSVFRFTMRLGISENQKSEPVDLPVLQGRSVLVVDDNATNRNILNDILNNWGMSVTTVDSATAAMEYLNGLPPDSKNELPIILSDVNMPDMDGFMLSAEIRKNPAFHNMVIILLTSGGQIGDAVRRKDLRISKQLMKPVKQSELFDAIIFSVQQPGVTIPVESKVEPTELPTLKPLNILLAEDGLTNQKLAVTLLERWGHRVTIAGDGQIALKFWQTQSFDAILMDVQMPEMDGLEATRQIRLREIESGDHIPIIAMTAHAMKGDRERCLEAGMDGYVAKPIRQRQFHEALAEFFPVE